MMPQSEASIHPLSMTTAEVKKAPMYDSVLVKKNLIKEKPGLMIMIMIEKFVLHNYALFYKNSAFSFYHEFS